MAVAKQNGAVKAVAKAESSTLDLEQVLRASKALIGKLNAETTAESKEVKTDLLADADADDTTTPIWLVLSTKKHIIDKKRLKPGKILLPHPYVKLEAPDAVALRVCLITADPQRRYKDLVEHPNFPVDTSKLISRVIGLEKLKAKYSSYESKRQLFGEHDVFLADDRIITYLPAILGKIFYKSSSKRPVPVSLQGRKQDNEEQGSKRRKLSEGGVKVQRAEPKPSEIAAEIEAALASALVHLAPSTTTSVKVGTHVMPAQHIQDNIKTVVDGLVEKYVPQKWNNVKAIHIKGPNTVALPIWLTDELWVDKETDVVAPRMAGEKAAKKRKRGALSEASEVLEVPGPDGKLRQVTKPKALEAKKTTKDKKSKAPAEKVPETIAAKPAKRTRMKAADLI